MDRSLPQFGIITLFPEYFVPLVEHGVVGRAIRQGRVELRIWDLRAFAEGPHRTVDDGPFGGGPGQVMSVPPLRRAIAAARVALPGAHVVYLSPQGRRLDQGGVNSLVTRDRLVLICGRYEGIDERVIERDIDAEWSIGDFVVSGGEIPAMAVLDAVIRSLPGVLGDAESATRDTFATGLLGYPQYTRPEEIDGQAVPAVLLSGHHGEIARWRARQALERTALRRPDLLAGRTLTREEAEILRQAHDGRDAGGRATHGAVADDGRDAGGRATHGAVADDGRDAGGRATHGAVAGEERVARVTAGKGSPSQDE
jgi:tRNA (guanine37-N1)-methyltransferase